MAKTLGSPLASMGMGGLEESDFMLTLSLMTQEINTILTAN
jgi:hypothetical protein